MATQLQQFLSSLKNGRRTQPSRFGRMAVGAVGLGSSTIGAAAVGAFAFGAVAVGALAIRQLAVKRARVGRLEIGELVVDRLVVREGNWLPNENADQPVPFAPRKPNGGNGVYRRTHRTASTLKPGDDAAAGTRGTAENICPDCSGTGLVNDAMCENCDGTGKVVQGLAGG